jgi:hypothetical protein
MPNGTAITTITKRMLCAAATRSVRAPWRSASSVISDAPPIEPEKYVVASKARGGRCANSAPWRRCNHPPNKAPSGSAHTTARIMAHHWANTKALT